MSRVPAVFALLCLIGGASALAEDNLQAGRELAATCTGCHGPAGASSGPVPPINGMGAQRMVTLLHEFRDGKREATIMHQLAKGYSDEQIRMLAHWFAAQVP